VLTPQSVSTRRNRSVDILEFGCPRLRGQPFDRHRGEYEVAAWVFRSISGIRGGCGGIIGSALATTMAAAAGSPQNASSTPDFSGVWYHWLRPGFGPSASGPGPVTNRSRINGVSNYNQLAGDYTNPVLNRRAAEIVKEHGDLSSSGVGYPTPSNQCWPEGVPYIFWQYGMQMLQQPDRVTILYLQDHQFRQVRLSQSQEHATPRGTELPSDITRATPS
jgi:hypothetical protein